MGRGASPRRRACAARAGLGVIACALATVAATPAFAQAPALELDVEAPVEQAAEPVGQAAQMAVQVAEPVTQAPEPVSEATEALVRTAEPLVDATAPALDAAKPAVRLSAPAVPITNLVRDLTQPERGPQPLRMRAQQGSEGSRHTFGGSARRGSGRPPNAGSELDSARRSPAGSGPATTGLIFDGPNPVSPTVPAGTAEDPVVPAAPRRHPGAPAAQRRVGTPGSAPMMVGELPRLTPEIVITAAPADSTTSPGSGPGSASPDRQPAPAPFGPGAGAAAGAAGAAAPVLALLVLLLLAAPSLSRFLRTVPAFLRPAPFVCALERPG